MNTKPNSGSFKKGLEPWNKGKKGIQVAWNKNLTKKESDGLKRMADSKMGDKNPLWQGGTSFIRYTVDWTETLRKSIRERDHYTCQVCGKEPAVHCHHIDYNKKNCDPNNIITLCQPCHNRTNINREHWKQYFYEKHQ